MIDQPLSHDDSINRAQSKVQTPVCLDESIRTAHYAQQAVQRDCDITNAMPSRAAGFAEAKRVRDVAPQGAIVVRNEPGFDCALDRDFIRRITVREEPIG
ncbi:MAG TPA: enolase C-terminal domain-like protein [Bryobacteraceae bacterium]|nr:enolase C-terminal domain-like protein [Bryobacteraceae bacterium]